MQGTYTPYLETALSVLEVTSAILMAKYNTDQEVQYKEDGSLVCEADIEACSAAVEVIKALYPEHQIDAEDAEGHRSSNPYRWEIDGLDGTINYVHRTDTFSSQIALIHEKDCVLAAITNPMTGELFYAIQGQGAYRNGKRIEAGTSRPKKTIPHLDKLKDGNEYNIFAGKMFSVPCWDGAAFDLSDIANKLRKKRAWVKTLCPIGAATMRILGGYMAGGFYEGVQHYDTAPSYLLIKEWDGGATDVYNNSIDFSKPQSQGLVIAHPSIHASLIQLLELTPPKLLHASSST